MVGKNRRTAQAKGEGEMSTAPLTADEIDYIFEAGYAIRSRWISPREGYEHGIYLLGAEFPIAILKSERACYNFIRRKVEIEAELKKGRK